MKKGILVVLGLTLHREYISLRLSRVDVATIWALLTSREPHLRSMKTLSLLGNITRETSREALREILRRNLRIDYNARGEREGGRAAIVADPFNPGDHISNMFRQRVQGQVRVVVDKDRWWGDIGEQADETVGVALSVAGAGAVIFSNTVYNMPAVILAYFS
jgi:hypothetical protein